jgi:cytochrome c553
MKKGIIAIAIVFAFAAAIMMGSGAIAQTTKSGDVKDTLEIKDPLFKKAKKSAVKFTHKQHSVDLKIKCTECHHVIKDGKNVWKEGDKVAMCSSCHKSPTKNEGKTLSLKKRLPQELPGLPQEDEEGPQEVQTSAILRHSTGL